MKYILLTALMISSMAMADNRPHYVKHLPCGPKTEIVDILAATGKDNGDMELMVAACGCPLIFTLAKAANTKAGRAEFLDFANNEINKVCTR